MGKNERNTGLRQGLMENMPLPWLNVFLTFILDANNKNHDDGVTCYLTFQQSRLRWGYLRRAM
jgi:hypothetical protein